MIKKYIFIFLIIAGSIFAQDKKEEIKQNTWLPTGVASFNISQVSLSNWAKGGENSLAFGLIGNFGLKYYSNPWKFNNTLKISFGKTKIGDQEFRTADNEIYMQNMLSYTFGWVVDPYVSNVFRTVIANGFDYSTDPILQTAAFFDPGYFQQGLGFTYQQFPNWNFRAGLGFKETITSKFNKYSDNPDTPQEIEKFKFETGIEAGIIGKAQLAENILFTTDLGLFSAFEELSVWDVRWDNTLTAKISNLFNVNFNVVVLYDKDQTLKTQLKEALQVGITYTLF